MAGKEAVAVIIDVGKTMGKELDGKVKLETAIEATKLLLQQKLLLSKSHEVGIVLMGSEDTANELAENYGGYEHVSIIQEMDVPTLDSMIMVSALESSNQTGDILDAIVVAVNMIENKIGKKKFKKRMFILTDGNCTANAPDQLQDIIDQINIQEIRVNVIGIGFGEEYLRQTDQQKNTFAVLQTIVASVQGVIYPSKTAMQIYKQFRKRSVYPVAKYKGPLDLGLGYRIDICIYGKTKEEPLPSLKKHSTVVEYTEEAKEGLVKMSREAALEDDPTSTVVDPQDIIKAYFYGKSVVPVTADDEELLKYPCRKCLKVLGYLSSSAIPRHYFMSGVDMILPNPSESDEIAFAAYVQALYQRDDVVLARYSYRDYTSVRLVVLTPCIKPELICLWLNFLPTSEDARDFPFADLTESTTEQNKATEDFILALSLDKTQDEDEKLKPSSLFSPTLQYFYQCLTFRAENPQAQLPELDLNIQKYICPDKEMFENAQKQCQKFAEAFILKPVETVKKEKKFYVDLLKGKPEDDKDEEDVGKIGEINPVQDFYDMIHDRKADKVDLAIDQMEELILKLLDRDFKGNMYKKAMDCLKALREGCKNEPEFSGFNTFLLVKIKGLQHIHVDFWNYMVDEGVSLITHDENKSSKITERESKNFLVKIQASQPKISSMDLDDIE
ncbi:hypothetical protein SteCoe_28760 [Stentor coeruleus]|uniref:VWFA domain-containing protein n=1 Tax=Stentor coeruleus TaxID=5963 RepID=A0A1R2B7I4_9CILI|nr:hypothetical protein SteCoe_28760 [Stentor coeruleus]